MQIMITHGSLARTRVFQVSPVTLVSGAVAFVALLLLMSGLLYHALFMAAAKEGWPVAGDLVRNVLQTQLAQRDRYVRENLDAMAQKVGELQAKLVQLEAMSERVSGLAGLRPEDARLPSQKALAGPKGGPYLPVSPTMKEINAAIDAMNMRGDERSDVFTMIESRLFEQRMRSLMVPSSAPVAGPISSGFGFRSDPFTGRTALHAGLDFPANVGTSIVAAAGGVVVASEVHPNYGNMVMIDHGNNLVTRYAHASKVLVKAGDLVKRGQLIAEVGSTGRSTGPHLHFEVHLDGVPQDPAKFLFSRNGERLPPQVADGR